MHNAEVFTFESQFSQTERVLLLKDLFHIIIVSNGQSETPDVVSCSLYGTGHDNWKCDFSLKITTNIIIVRLNLHSQYSSTHEAVPLLTCNFHASTFKCVALAKVICTSLLVKVICDFCHRLYSLC